MSEIYLPDKVLEPFLALSSHEQIGKDLLGQFLVDTEYLDIEASERLRYLAIKLENKDFSNGWLSQKLIYDLATSLNPNNVRVYESLVISALNWIDLELDASSISYVEIANVAEQEVRKALFLFPEEADLNYVYGLLLYQFPTGSRTAEALEQFQRTHNSVRTHLMALLYKAHCLHDLQRWQEAFAAYSEINEQAFLETHPHWQWRVLKIPEQKAYCAAKLGKSDIAQQILNNYFNTLYDLDIEELNDQVANLDDSFDLITNFLNEPELLSRLKVIAKRADLSGRYQW